MRRRFCKKCGQLLLPAEGTLCGACESEVRLDVAFRRDLNSDEREERPRDDEGEGSEK